MKTLPIYLLVHESTMMAASVELPSLGLRVASRAEIESKPSLGLPIRFFAGGCFHLDDVPFDFVGDVYHHGPNFDVDMVPTHAAALLQLVRSRGWSVAHGSASWIERLACPRPLTWSDVAPPPSPRERWERILMRYVAEQRDRVASTYAPGGEEFDGLMDGLRILEQHVGRPVTDIAATVTRREKAGQGLIQEGRSYATSRRHLYATRQVITGGEIALAAAGSATVSERAKVRCAELDESIRKEGRAA